MPASISPFIASLPKAELHMHLEGSLEPETIIALAKRNDMTIAYDNADELRRAYTYRNLQDFLDLFYLGLTVLQTGGDFYQMTRAYLERAVADNVLHAEVFISPQAHLRRNIPIAVVIENILRAFDDMHAAHGLTGGVVAGIQRQFDESDALAMIASLKPWRDRVLGLGAGGPEIGNPPSKFRKAYAYARDEFGWRTMIHAGEEGGSDYVREAIHILGVDRVDHGVRCEPDPSLVDELRERGTPLTVCPCSNIMLKVFPAMSAHNIRRLHEAGLCITVNSDDPSYFSAYLNDNYAAIQDALGLSDLDLWQMARNSFTSAFLTPELRAKYLAELDACRPAT